MTAIAQEFRPDQVAIEMPYFSRQIKAAGGVMQALGVINLVIYRELNCLPIMLHQASWKCHLGHGRATKDEVAEILQNFLNPEDAVEVEEEVTTPVNDLPWKDEDVKVAPKKELNYTLKTPAKASKADKFDALFEEEEN
jgi:hypothetical protein